jgi:hypothetical protein
MLLMQVGAINELDRRSRMQVAVKESGQDHLALQVEDLGAGPDIVPDAGVRADVDDLFARDCEGLGPRAARVNRIDRTVAQYPICLSFAHVVSPS